MALSNIFNEPAKELTEQLVGTVTLIGFGWLDWCAAAWVVGGNRNHPETVNAEILRMCLTLPVLLIMALVVLIGAVVFCHSVGEMIIGLGQLAMEAWHDRRASRIPRRE